MFVSRVKQPRVEWPFVCLKSSVPISTGKKFSRSDVLDAIVVDDTVDGDAPDRQYDADDYADTKNSPHELAAGRIRSVSNHDELWVS